MKSYLGSIGAVAGENPLFGQLTVLLQTGDHLQFQGHDADGARVTPPVRIQPVGDGYQIELGSLTDNQLPLLTLTVAQSREYFSLDQRIAAAQKSASTDFLNLQTGDAINIYYANATGFANAVGLIRLDQDPVTCLPLGSVSGQLPGTAAFDEAVKAGLVKGLAAQTSGSSTGSGAVDDIYWIAPAQGIYAVVAVTPAGAVFTYGLGQDGKPHVQTVGSGAFAFETATGSQDDRSFTDFIVKVSADTNVNRLIYSLYKTLFDRDADSVGLKYWIDTSQESRSKSLEITDHFMRSDEYKVYFGTVSSNAGFVDKLYQYSLNRVPDPKDALNKSPPARSPMIGCSRGPGVSRREAAEFFGRGVR